MVLVVHLAACKARGVPWTHVPSLAVKNKRQDNKSRVIKQHRKTPKKKSVPESKECVSVCRAFDSIVPVVTSYAYNEYVSVCDTCMSDEKCDSIPE